MLTHYLRVSLKVLARRPFFTFVSLFGISLTLAVLTLAAALVEHTFGPVTPEVNADRMLGVFEIELSNDQGNHYRGEASYGLLDRHFRDLELAEHTSLIGLSSSLATFVGGQKVSLRLRRVDGAFFKVMQFDFLEGAPFTEQDNAEARPVAVISERTRQLLFGGQQAVGETFELDGQRLRVVGVVKNVPAFRPVSTSDVWSPIHAARSDAYRHGMVGRFQAVFLAENSQRLDALRSEIEARLRLIDPTEERDFTRFAAQVDTPFDRMSRPLLELFGVDLEARTEANAQSVTGGGGPSLSPSDRVRLILALAAVVFMVLPSLNLVNLNLSRIFERVSEIGVRKSYGASSRTLIGQFLVENLVLTSIGGALGFVIAGALLQVVSGSALVSYAQLALNPAILARGLLMMFVFALISGVYPAWRMSRLQPKQALEDSPS